MTLVLGEGGDASRQKQKQISFHVDRIYLVNALHVCTLTTFAVAAPLLEKLAQNAEFFAARRTDPGTIIALALIVTFLPPACLIILESIGGRRLHTPILALLLAAICLQAFHEAPVSGIISMLISAIAGAMMASGYNRYPSVRKFLTVMSPAALLLPAYFLLVSPVAAFIVPGQVTNVYPDVRSRTTVVVLLFDELPLVSLLDAREQIDARYYPNFARLATEATWYRNASTVADRTVNAVPSILSGLYPEPGKLPVAGDYPRNLFSLLGGRYEVQACETVTGLCPKNLLEKDLPWNGLDSSLRALLRDVGVIYLHLVIPKDMPMGLPDLAATWKNYGTFAGYGPAHNEFPELYLDRAADYRAFLQSLHVTARPSLIFAHTILPHMPWRFLPSGRAYADDDAPTMHGRGPRETWIENRAAVADAWQRHLLQVGFADRLLGEAIARLKALGIYDDCLLIVTSDHGCSFRLGGPRRKLEAGNYAAIISVPLFVKMPHQRVGVVDDRNVQSIDILPSIAEALGIRLSWPLDGRSFMGHRECKSVKTCYSDGRPMEFDPKMPLRKVSLSRKVGIFGGDDGLYNYGPHRELFGCAVSSLPRAGDSGLEWELADADRFLSVKPGSAFVPAWIHGQIFGRRDRLEIAIAVNGVVRATRHAVPQGDCLTFEAVVHEESFKAGVNSIQLYQIVTADGRQALAPMRGQ